MNTPSSLATARFTGLAYLGIVATGIFAEFVVRGTLVHPDDPVSTAAEIAARPDWFRLGMGADALMLVLDVAVGLGLFRLLRHVDRRLAGAALGLRLLQGAVIAVNLLHLDRALDHALAAVGGAGTIAPGPARAALDAIERHALGYDVGLIPFGLSCLVVAALLRRGGLVGRPLWIGLGASGVVYLLGSSAAVFAPDLAGWIDPLYVIPMAAEFGFATRLVRRGLEPADRRPAPMPAPVPA